MMSVVASVFAGTAELFKIRIRLFLAGPDFWFVADFDCLFRICRIYLDLLRRDNPAPVIIDTKVQTACTCNDIIGHTIFSSFLAPPT